MVRARSSIVLSNRLEARANCCKRPEKLGSVYRRTFIAGLTLRESGTPGKAEFLIFEMALLLLIKRQRKVKLEMTTFMKVSGQTTLKFIYAESVSFTLSIQKKALHPLLYPFSSKKLTSRTVKYESERQFPR